MDSSKMISEQLFLLIPMLYNQIIRPIEGALRAKISPLQFYALMALKREGCMTMSALSAHCGVSKQQSTCLLYTSIPVIVYRRGSIGLQMKGIDHIDII